MGGMAEKMLTGSSSRGSESLNTPLVGEEGEITRRLGCVAGTVLEADQQRFMRALWRSTRGNVFIDFQPIEAPIMDPKTGMLAKKSVFVIYFQQSEGAGNAMQAKVSKVCTQMAVNTYAWPTSLDQAKKKKEKLGEELKDKTNIKEKYEK